MMDGQPGNERKRGRNNALLGIALALFFVLIAWFVVEGRRRGDLGAPSGQELNAPEAGAPVAPGGQ